MKRQRPIYKRWGILTLLCLFLGCAIGYRGLMPKELAETADLSSQFGAEFPQNIQTTAGIRFAEIGNQSGPTLFLIHGSPGNWQAWSRFLLDEDLQREFLLVAPDRLGYGGTAPGQAVGSMAKQAATLAKLTEGRPRPWIWAGHSFGASIIARLAMDSPEKVDGLVFAAGAMSPDYERQKWYHRIGAHSWVRPLLSPDWDVSNQEAIAFEHEFELMIPLWKQIVAPTVIIHGKDDWLADYRHVDFALEKMTNAEIELIALEDAGHLIIWDRYEDVKASLLRFSEP